MNYLLFTISILLILFLNAQTAPLIGVTKVVTATFSPMIMYLAIETFKKKIVWNSKYNKTAIIILILSVIIIVLKSATKQSYFNSVFYFLIIPMLMSISFEELSNKKIRILRRSVLFFYIIECSLAFYERIMHINFFDIKELTYNQLQYYNPEDWEFRSTSLLGHPLANAMAVVIILSFILSSNMKLVYKTVYFFMGYLSLFCFNARGAILIATILLLPYIWNLFRKSNIKYKWIIYSVFTVSIYYFFVILTTTSLGGRIFYQTELLDGSAQARLEVLSFYKYLNLNDILWGNPDSYLNLTYKLGAGGVENGIITIMINYGIIITLFMLPALIYFHYNKLSVYSKYDRLWIISVFYILGTMNPNLSMPLQWIIWVLAYYSFRKKGFKSL